MDEEEKLALLKETEKIMLDNYCSAILVLLWKSREMRFNEIHRALRNKGIELSKPTLSEHLKHLRKKKWLTRTVKGVQNVTYTLHKSIHRSSPEEAEKWLEDLLSKEGLVIEKPSPEVEALYALRRIIALKIEEILLRIDIEPNIKNSVLSFDNSKARSYENDIISLCNRNPSYRKVVVKKAKELLDMLNEEPNDSE